MPREITIRARLNASKTSPSGHITYVFEDLDATDPDARYIMCVRFPNWSHGEVKVGDTGFATLRFVVQGQDTWNDGMTDVPYRTTDVHFIKFVPLVEEPDDIAVEDLSDEDVGRNRNRDYDGGD